MLSLSSALCLAMIIVQSYCNPVGVNEYNSTAADGSARLLCNHNSSLQVNSSLYELLNHDRLWYVAARTTFIYRERTWNNVLMKTSASLNGSVHVEFIGENSNGSCVHSEIGKVESETKSGRVSIHWPNSESSLEMVFVDDSMIHFVLCDFIDSNTTDICALNQLEEFFVRTDEQENANDTLLWLKSHCSSIDVEDLLTSNNSRKCLPHVLQTEINETRTVEGAEANATEVATFQAGTIEQENQTNVTDVISDSTVRTNRTNRLEILEEYYGNQTDNVTNDEQPESVANVTTTTIEVKQIILLSTNASDEADSGHVDQKTGNETETDAASLFVLHKGMVVETTIESLTEDSKTTTSSFTSPSSIDNDSIEPDLNETSSIDPLTIDGNATSIEPLFNESTKSLSMPNTTEVVKTNNETIVATIETTSEAVTTIVSPTPAIPADCPVLKDCPFDYCAFARKLDHRGCPTCNCLQSESANLTCPPLTCQSCLYGHYTDPNGCSICQCQSRPYPPLGERCPSLNCAPCYFGTVKDEYNCDTCVCIRPNSQECPVLDCTFGPCKHGSVKDEDDCPSCECLLPTATVGNTSKVNCSMSATCSPCHLGYIRDADGCPTCQCKLRGTVPCASLASECRCEFGSYLNADGCDTCSCLPDPKNASRQACWELSNQANFYNLTSGPTCAPDGSFSARQCDKAESKCWCVTPTGIHISGFESRLEENVNCACAVELYQVSSLRMIGHHLLCLLNGNYAPVQCDGRYCSCVDEHGKSIGPSVSIQNRDQLRCVGVYQQLHPERFLLHRATIEHTDFARLPHGISSSLCLTHLEQVRNANVTDDHILIPVCDGNGLYASVQCDQTERYCWCVDKKTGVEMDGTRRLNGRPQCHTI